MGLREDETDDDHLFTKDDLDNQLLGEKERTSAIRLWLDRTNK